MIYQLNSCNHIQNEQLLIFYIVCVLTYQEFTHKSMNYIATGIMY